MHARRRTKAAAPHAHAHPARTNRARRDAGEPTRILPTRPVTAELDTPARGWLCPVAASVSGPRTMPMPATVVLAVHRHCWRSRCPRTRPGPVVGGQKNRRQDAEGEKERGYPVTPRPFYRSPPCASLPHSHTTLESPARTRARWRPPPPPPSSPSSSSWRRRPRRRRGPAHRATCTRC